MLWLFGLTNLAIHVIVLILGMESCNVLTTMLARTLQTFVVLMFGVKMSSYFVHYSVCKRSLNMYIAM